MKLTLPVIAALAVSPALSIYTSPTPITEIITGIANEQLNANPSLISTLKVKTDSGPKLLEETWGQRIQEAGTWQGFLTWESSRHPPSLQYDEDFKQAASQIFSSYTFSHVAFNPVVNLTQSVTAPITETLFTSIKDGVDKNMFDAVTQHVLDVTGAAEGCISTTFGHRIENQTAAVMVVGWSSAEASQIFAASNASAAIAPGFLAVANIQTEFDVNYTNFLQPTM